MQVVNFLPLLHFIQKCNLIPLTMSAPLIPALSIAAVTEALLHMKSASTRNLQFTFTLQFKFIYFTQKHQSAVQLLSRPRTY